MEIQEQETEKKNGRKTTYQRCLEKAMDKTHQLLCEKDAAYDSQKIHAAKSILYAAIEQAGMETERLISAQELLRELLSLVALQADPIPRERQEAFRILEELKNCHPSR